jgi:hypothetical protein
MRLLDYFIFLLFLYVDCKDSAKIIYRTSVLLASTQIVISVHLRQCFLYPVEVTVALAMQSF